MDLARTVTSPVPVVLSLDELGYLTEVCARALAPSFDVARAESAGDAGLVALLARGLVRGSSAGGFGFDPGFESTAEALRRASCHAVLVAAFEETAVAWLVGGPSATVAEVVIETLGDGLVVTRPIGDVEELIRQVSDRLLAGVPPLGSLHHVLVRRGGIPTARFDVGVAGRGVVARRQGSSEWDAAEEDTIEGVTTCVEACFGR